MVPLMLKKEDVKMVLPSAVDTLIKSFIGEALLSDQ